MPHHVSNIQTWSINLIGVFCGLLPWKSSHQNMSTDTKTPTANVCAEKKTNPSELACDNFIWILH